MTVSTTNFFTVVQGNDATTEFDFDFTVDSALNIDVYYIDDDDDETLLTSNLYEITLNPIASGELWPVGGSVEYPLSGSPIATGTSLRIQRATPYQQEVTIANQGSFYPQVVERGMDLLEMQMQQTLGNGTSGLGSIILMEGVTPSAAISEMPFAGSITSFDYVPIVSDALNYKAYVGDIVALSPLEASFEFLGGTPPEASEILGICTFTSGAIIPDDFAGASGNVITDNPTGNYTCLIKHGVGGNLTTIGNMTITTSGNFTFLTSGALTVDPGECIVFEGNATPDSTLADFSWTIQGTRTSS